MDATIYPLPLWTAIPFLLTLLCIAILPLTFNHFWERNLNKAAVMAIFSFPVITLFIHYGDLHPLIHEIQEYFSFISLLFCLFVISGGIYLSGDIQATPRNNLIFLMVGGVMANLLGTTGASMLLIRPLLRTNQERRHISHIPIFFIFIVSNIGGCLLPIGDPPLFMGYLRGVPFFWTLKFFPQWLFMIALLLAVFYSLDLYFWNRESSVAKKEDRERIEPLSLHGRFNFLFIIGVLLSIVFLSFPLREVSMIALALLSLFLTPKELHKENRFCFAPIIEVAVIFLGIFITMVPALIILNTRAEEIGLRLPWHFFWATGILSSFLDNAPTYVSFFSLAQGLGAQGVCGIQEEILVAISLGAVFMGANTYIGNGPNFMTKAICEASGVKMPSFFGYILWSLCILFPLFIVLTIVFF